MSSHSVMTNSVCMETDGGKPGCLKEIQPTKLGGDLGTFSTPQSKYNDDQVLNLKDSREHISAKVV